MASEVKKSMENYRQGKGFIKRKGRRPETVVLRLELTEWLFGAVEEVVGGVGNADFLADVGGGRG